jgi:hypothetical protein
VDADDPFAQPTEAAVSDLDNPLRRGRYMLPWKDGSHKGHGFQRVSNLVSAYSDQYALRLWEIGEVLQGLGIDPALYATVLAAKLHEMSKAERRTWTEQFIEHAKEASGGNAASKHGSLQHAAVEELHAGLPVQHHAAGTRRNLALYASALQRHGLKALPGMQERIVLVEELEVCGRLDNILTDGVRSMIADLKTQKRFWTWLEIKAQQATYAHGDAMWDAKLGQWVDMPPVSQEVACILSMPRLEPGEEPHVDVWEVDIVAGWETAKRAREVVLDRALAKSINPGAWLRPAPDATAVERYAARYAAVETFADGRNLYRECLKAGVWCEPLAQAAKQAYARLSVPA